jgi:hypothetical protein
MEARNRSLKNWYGKIERGEIKLPRFQRFESWDWRRISSLANTITHNLPLGITLVLEIGGKEQFVSRYLVTAPETDNYVLEHLLDGQQRLTALWRVLHNNYEDHTFFVYIPEFDNYGLKDSDEEYIFCRARYFLKNGQKYPLWCDIPAESLQRGMIPTHLLKPIDMQSEIDQWIDSATNHLKPREPEKFEDFFNWKKSVSDRIKDLRSVVSNYNLPYLSLPSNTSKDIALEVFINMNTNSKPLSTYDIIVAEVESELGQSLHDKQSGLVKDYPGVAKYDDISRLILNTSALLQEKLPNQKGAWDMNKVTMVENWDRMSIGLDKMAQLLNSEGIFDNNRLPTNAILWVIAALYNDIPDAGDEKGWADNVLRQYIWRSFFTDRYENSAATHAYYDYIALKKVIKGGVKENGEIFTLSDVPIFKEDEYKIADANELINTTWPKNVSIRGRAVLSVTTKLGAYDFASEEKVSETNIVSRHYHHIFPDSLIEEAGLDNSYIAMNCALISDRTNLNIGRKDPIKYLKERYEWASEETIEYRLNSHLIPKEELANGGYENLSKNERQEKIRNDYKKFIEKRALYFALAAEKLCRGEHINANDIIETVNNTTLHGM